MKREQIFPDAVADIQGSNDYPLIRGQVRFYQRHNCVLVEASIQDLPITDTGFFGFHIHEGHSCTGIDFSDTGSHYNPKKTAHPLHAGDLPPLMYCNGYAYMTVATGRFSIADVIGRTVILHNMVDDFHTQPAGNAGTKIACGVIQSANIE